MARVPFITKPSAEPMPTGPTAPETSIDGHKLRVDLTAIALDQSNDRNAVLELFKSTLTIALDGARERFEMGRLGGLEMARLISSIHDDIITALFDYTVTHIVRAPNPTSSERIALCAVGGYGRGEMAPHSDVDLLFLIAEKKGSAFTESVTEFILYMLWDLGLKVGHSTRTADQCMKLAKEDQTILTALLDMRFVAGDDSLADELYADFRRSIQGSRGRAYIATKLEERDKRHEREGNSRYVIEPNIKEGKGGLRDLHVLYWIALYLENAKDIADPQKASDYVDMGLFDERAATRFERAADFLWRARIHLHFSAGRATETLSFDRQTVLARKLGHASGAVEEAVEKFMREYFTNAREVGALTRIACAKLEEDNAIRLPLGLDHVLGQSRRGLKGSGFILRNGRLDFEDEMQIREDPKLIMQLFNIAGRKNLDIHPDAFQAINFRRNLIDNEFRRDADISKIFQDLLLTAKAPYATLKAMNEAGVLGRYLLEFGGIVARTQFNMHHAYTVDEHSLRLVRYFHDLLTGELDDDHPLNSSIAQGFTNDERLTIYLTCLLHDTGKGKGDQCVEGAQLTRRACRRLGVSQDIIDTASWLVRRHLDMSDTAQRRDISDPDTIASFGKLMGSQARLNLLSVLTVVDIRSVGPGIWNDWKGALLRDLYQSTSRFLEGKDALAPTARAAAAREQFVEFLPGTIGTRIAPIIDDLDNSYWLNFNMADLLRHGRFFEKAVDAKTDTKVEIRRDRENDVTELWVLTRDRDRLFADLTKAIAACGATIVGARLHTGHNGRVMDVFYLQNADGLAFGRQSDQAIKMIKRRAKAAALGDIGGLSISPARASRRAGAIPVKPIVRFPDFSSDDVSIIEVIGRDRPGLLYALAKALHGLGLSVLSAHIEVVGEKAVDAFYVQGNLDTPEIQKRVRKALKQALSGTPKKEAA
ncbi:[protein-PII] uridylyltransferase [Fretibacter rubidus]|uniref:[protein-PII] uridylyltransferase n=1 Tax=Fretibacter rubidus TaxID=570162 RepID=UPI00352A7BCC